MNLCLAAVAQVATLLIAVDHVALALPVTAMAAVLVMADLRVPNCLISVFAATSMQIAIGLISLQWIARTPLASFVPATRCSGWLYALE